MAQRLANGNVTRTASESALTSSSNTDPAAINRSNSDGALPSSKPEIDQPSKPEDQTIDDMTVVTHRGKQIIKGAKLEKLTEKLYEPSVGTGRRCVGFTLNVCRFYHGIC